MRKQEKPVPPEAMAKVKEVIQLASRMAEYAEDGDEIITAIHEHMEDYEFDMYSHLDVVGIGVVSEASLWKIADHGYVMVGWQDDERISIAFFHAGLKLSPLPTDDGELVTLQ